MFTGIIEALGRVDAATAHGSGKTFWISSPISGELKIDQSVSHNGVCLTVEELAEGKHRVTAVSETLSKTSLGSWQTGSLLNLERCMQLNGRLDGHLVQGHVDTTGTCLSVTDLNGSWEFRFSFPEQFADLLIEKGSICLDGVSLTAFNVSRQQFSVAIIPFTFHHTHFSKLKPGATVNLEFDVIGKYIQRRISLSNP